MNKRNRREEEADTMAANEDMVMLMDRMSRVDPHSDEDHEDDSRTSDFSRAFVAKFTNNCVSNERLLEMSLRPNAKEIYNIDPKKLWIVQRVAMPIETFSLMRFMCSTLEEFINLVIFGSLNEIKQVHSTLAMRTQLQEAAITDGIKAEFMGMHPGKCLAESWNPESAILGSMHNSLVQRAANYMSLMVMKPGTMRAKETNGGTEGECADLYCSVDHRRDLVAITKQSCMISVPAKSWQRQHSEAEIMVKNFRQFENMTPCEISETMVERGSSST